MINYHDVRYKRTLCKNFQTTGQCVMGIRCHFAHGQEEIRNPAIDPLVQYPALAALMQNPAALSSKLVRCKYNDIGSCKYGASCHYSHEITKLNIASEYMAIVQRAAEILAVQNVQGCSQLLNEVINRTDCSPEEKKQYEQIISQAQQLAVNLMTQFSSPQQQQLQQQPLQQQI
ncbi:hypothetical protein IMG5_197860 [Ichthyophthirius multifiliis]|uniref:C3H1-type domain-containing protein n=1 Tax=Ichthyophthirius multifiliis TaxID=5932 RepID=G0R5C9_ICHMU|nr:hypothetical protein IMG5_197860 [Ichthyophthirius multifiliis]EGR27318.1 hypothetical protein IMG5_197860 [Ichthyophthirius multifiliis]|eukprot:XP_004024202.1 hypothetical protein IMG5_197860 [Ichthyophthirius multifiliis]